MNRPMFVSRRAIVILSVIVCLGLIPSYTLIQSVVNSTKIKLSAEILAEQYNEDVPTLAPPYDGHHRSKESDAAAYLMTNGTRRVFLDCGANTASSVQLFRDTYPEGRDYVIHSFEIDIRLVPYFSPYSKHELHCPIGVAFQNGNITAYLESVWAPDKGLNNGMDMQWGGGTFYAHPDEVEDRETGGKRKLSTRHVVATVDLAQWIQDSFSVDDYVILKIDVEGAEFDILRRMLNLGTFRYIDKLYGEYHYRQPTGWSSSSKNQLVLDISKAGFILKEWEADRNTYSDFESLHPVQIPINTPGIAGDVYSLCRRDSLAIAVAIGMNHKRAHKLVSMLRAYRTPLPVTLFVYGDFVEQFPDTVSAWARRFKIGIREDGYYPRAYLEMMPSASVRRCLVNSIMRAHDIGCEPVYYWPSVDSEDSAEKFRRLAKARGLRVIKPVAEFPWKLEMELTVENYYRYRDVERIPRALRLINDRLSRSRGGILGLDADIPDTYMISVFLMDYLVDNSDYKLVEIDDCVTAISNVTDEVEVKENEKVHIDVWDPKYAN